MVLIQNIGIVPEKPIDPEGDIRRVSYSAYQLWRFLFGDMWDNREKRNVWDMGPIGLIWPAKAPKKAPEEVPQKEGPATTEDLKKTAPYFPSGPGYLRDSPRPLITGQRKGPTQSDINVPRLGPYGGGRMTMPPTEDHDHDDRYSKLGHGHQEYVRRDELDLFTGEQLDKITDQGNIQVDRVTKEGDSQIEKVADKGDSVIELIQKMEEDSINNIGEISRKLIEETEQAGNAKIDIINEQGEIKRKAIEGEGEVQRKSVKEAGKDYIKQIETYAQQAMQDIKRSLTEEDESIRAELGNYQIFRKSTTRLELNITRYNDQKTGLNKDLYSLKCDAERVDKDYGKLETLEKYHEKPEGKAFTKTLSNSEANLPSMAKEYEKIIKGLKNVSSQAKSKSNELNRLALEANGNITEAQENMDHFDATAIKYRDLATAATEEHERTVEMEYLIKDLPEEDQDNTIEYLANRETQNIQELQRIEKGYEKLSQLFGISHSNNEEYASLARIMEIDIDMISTEAKNLARIYQAKLDKVQNYIDTHMS